MASEQDRKISEAASEPGWPKLMARMMEDITRSELERFEESGRIAQNRGRSGYREPVSRYTSGIIGGGCLLAALILLLGQWLAWWMTFAVAATPFT
jgi:hypothetical protein